MRLTHIILALAATALILTGCHSAFIEVTISNRTTQPLSLVELDYPSASFGTQTLAPGHDFHYRFKVLGSGPTTILWSDPTHLDHKSPGPLLHENDEGRIIVTFLPTGPIWDQQLSPAQSR